MVSSFPPSLDGIASYTFGLVMGLATRGPVGEILVLSDSTMPKERRELLEDSDIEVLKAWSPISIITPFRVWLRILNFRPDVVHVQYEYSLYGRGMLSLILPLTLSMIKIFRIPLLLTFHTVIPLDRFDRGFFERHGLGKRFASLKRSYIINLTKLLGMLSNGVVVHVRSAREILAQDYGFNEARMHVIPHGLKAPLKETVTAQEAKKNTDLLGKITVLCFGFVRGGKGIEHAINAMSTVVRLHPNAILVVLGRMPSASPENIRYAGQLKDLVEGLRLLENVRFVDSYLLEEEVWQYFSAADIVVFPYVDDEIVGASGPLSTTIFFGKPVVATRIARFTDELTEGVNALLVDPSDVRGLADALSSLVENDDLRFKLSRELRKLAPERDWRSVAQKTFALYQMLKSSR